VAEVRHLSISIQRPWQTVYEYAANPANLPKWATGLGSAIRKIGSEWEADSPMGRVRIRFAAPNGFGILDHDVVLESGETVHNPMRVIPNGGAAEVVFTLFRRPAMSEAQFAADGEWIAKDLRKLKAILEG
jgi:hypothetical protein